MTIITNSCLLYSTETYSVVLAFWPLEELDELAAVPTGCGEVARGGCLFAWNFSVTRSFVLFGWRSEGLGHT